MSALDFAAMLRAEKRKARSAVAAPAPAPPKQQQSRPPPDAATAALDPSKQRPPLQTLPGAPPTIAYAADWISEAEEAAPVEFLGVGETADREGVRKAAVKQEEEQIAQVRPRHD